MSNNVENPVDLGRNYNNEVSSLLELHDVQGEILQT